MIITRAELRLYLKDSPYRHDPLVRRVLKTCLAIMNERGVDKLGVEDNLQTQISA